MERTTAPRGVPETGTESVARRGAPEAADPASPASPAAGRTTEAARAAQSPRSWPVSRLRPRRISVTSGLCAAAYAVSIAVLFATPLGRQWNFVDLGVYRHGGSAVQHGVGLYGRTFLSTTMAFTYPPFAAIAFIPLGWLSTAQSQIFATMASLLLFPLVCRLALRLPPLSSAVGAASANRLALLAAAAGIWFEPMWTTLRYGQINVLICLLVLYDVGRPDRSRWKGVGIGVATGLKLTPLIFTAYLLITRRYRAAGVSLAAFAGTIALGFAVTPGSSAIYWTHDVENPNRVGRIENAANQSLRGAAARLLHSLNVETPWLVAAALVGLFGLWLAARSGRRGDEAAGFGLCAVTGLLISPISWTHHWVLAMPALLLLAVRGYRARNRAVLACCLAATAVACSHMTWWVPVGGSDELHQHGWQLVVSDAYVLCGLAVLAIAGLREWRLSHPRGRDPGSFTPRA